MSHRWPWRRVPEPPLDPPEEPELPEAEGKCELCGEENWGPVEERGDNAIAHCNTEKECPKCQGHGKATTDPNALAALSLMGEEKCSVCAGEKIVPCEGMWSKYIGPPDPPERERD